MASVAIIHNHPIHYQHLLFCELAQRGLDFEVVFTAASGASRIEAPLPRSSEYRYAIGHAGPYEEAPKFRIARFVWKALERIRPAVVIISGYSDIAAWTAWLWGVLHQADKILWAESNIFDHRRHGWKEAPKRVFVKGCTLAHVYGTSSLEYVENLGMPRDRIQTKRAIANTALFLNAREAEVEKQNAIRLIYCGRLSPEKNLAFLFRAFAALDQNVESPRLVLKLVGHGLLEEPLRKLTHELGIAKMVDFMGRAQQHELPRIFRNSDVLLLPSISEPWGLVVNEAMLSGLPVAVSDRCGCAADLVKPETGWTFSSENEAELTKLLARIADTPRETLEQMGKAGRSLAAEYSPENCARLVVEMVNGLLHVPGSQGHSAAQGTETKPHICELS